MYYWDMENTLQFTPGKQIGITVNGKLRPAIVIGKFTLGKRIITFAYNDTGEHDQIITEFADGSRNSLISDLSSEAAT